MQARIKDFENTELFTVKRFPHDYSAAKSEGSFMVTDYSSVALDFAYLKKPILYSQIDDDTYYKNSVSNPGYLSYEKQGLGPVARSYEDTVNNIVDIVQGDCEVDEEYSKRAKDFFYKFDKNNALRVYQSILSMDEDYGLGKQDMSTQSVRAYWWRYNYPAELNFGDEMTPYLLKKIWNVKPIISTFEDARLYGVGSILQQFKEYPGSLNASKKKVVWGSGFIENGKDLDGTNIEITAARGRCTLDRIETNKEVPLGDPGILANRVFKKAKKQVDRIGVVYHYADEDSDLICRIRNDSQFLIINPLQTPEKVAEDISSCALVLSSSLHGLIFADSYAIPNYWMPLSKKVRGGDYKFRDYYTSINKELKTVSTKVLDDKKALKTLIDDYQPVEDLRKIQDRLISALDSKLSMISEEINE